jgi:hypothetical protein
LALQKEKQLKQKRRGVADLDTLAGFEELMNVGSVWQENKHRSSAEKDEKGLVAALRAQVCTLIFEKNIFAEDNQRLRGEVSHLENLVDGLVRLLEGEVEEVATEGSTAEGTEGTKLETNHSQEKENVPETLPLVPSTPLVFHCEKKNKLTDSAFDKGGRMRGRGTPGTTQAGHPDTSKKPAQNPTTNYSDNKTDSLSAWLDDTVKLSAIHSSKPVMTNYSRDVNGKALDFEGWSEVDLGSRSVDVDVRQVLRSADSFLVDAGR